MWTSLVGKEVLSGIEITDLMLEEELNNNGDDTIVGYDDEKNLLVYFNDTKRTYKVDEDGNIIQLENAPSLITETIYVTLYSDGLMAFSSNSETDSTRTVTKKYTIEKDDIYTKASMVPWNNETSSIKKVIFVNEIRPISTARWFYKCFNISSIENISNLNTSRTVTFEAMFRSCAKLASLDLSTWDTRRVTNISAMFMGCVKLTSLDLSTFNTSRVINMSGIFDGWRDDTNKYGTMSLTNLDISSFDTSKVTNMTGMFRYCSNLTDLNVSNFNTGNVTSMNSMFQNCSKLISLDLSNFDTKKVINTHDMFGGWDFVHSTNLILDLKTIYVGESWDMSSVIDSESMFNNCKNIVGGNGTTYNSSKIDKTYARIDGGPTSSTPGYFTYKSSK